MPAASAGQKLEDSERHKFQLFTARGSGWFLQESLHIHLAFPAACLLTAGSAPDAEATALHRLLNQPPQLQEVKFLQQILCSLARLRALLPSPNLPELAFLFPTRRA